MVNTIVTTVKGSALQILSVLETLHPDLATLGGSLIIAAVLLWAVTWVVAAKTYTNY